MRRLIVLATVLSLLLSVGPVNAVAPVQAGRGGSTDARAADRYIVLLRDGSDVDGAIGRLSRGLAIRPDHAYRHAVRGFSAHLNAHQLAEVKADPSVALVEADRAVQLESQTLPTGVDRVDADLSPTAKIDGLDERVDADIAIIDTGIQADHPDLNVAGGHNCINANPADWGDGNGHGTHVAGITGAKDNLVGVVGVAPGARLWAVRVFDSTGFSLLSWIVCGIDWITSQKDPTDSSRPLFEAANMSLRDAGSDDGNCGYTNGDAEHQAICRSVAAGTTYAVAAGNDRTDAGQWIPAAYPEVITVSALADFNGRPGGGAPSTCSSFGSEDSDDTFADFSNFGPAVDLIAPGKCIYSTYSTLKSTGTGYAVLSGTSMATPHVAGAIALYKVGHPTATPSEVQAALQAAGTLDWFTNTDPDATHERLLNVSSFGAPPDLPSHSVSGTVRDPASLPVANATVTIEGTPLAPATTNGSGVYSFASVPEGSYSVRADPPNRCLNAVTRPLTVGASNVTNFDFDLPQKQDAFGYRCRVEVTAFVNGTDLLALSGDDAAALVALPFSITFYGTSYANVYVTTNGLVSFTGGSTAWANTSIPGTASPNAAIYPYWDDLYIDSPTANIYTASLGSAPNRQFVVEWRNVRHFGDATRRVGFEVILNENGDVQTMYKDVASGDGLEMGNSATVGIENQTGTVALQYSYNEGVLSTGLAVRYFKPSGGGNVAPVATNDTATTNEDEAVSVNVLANDADANGDALSVRQVDVSSPAHGTAVVNPDSTITYTPTGNYSGPDSFTYRAWDGLLTSDLATVNVTVNPVNDAPTVNVVLLGGTSACLSDSSPSGRIALLPADVDNDPATLSLSATSSLAKVLANVGLSFAGVGADRSLTATGTGTKGTSTITVTVWDGSASGQTTVRFMVGTGSTNTLNGSSGADMLFGLAGNDTLRGNAGIDLMCGGSGNDKLTGGADADYFSGGTGTDTNVDFVTPLDLWDGT